MLLMNFSVFSEILEGERMGFLVSPRRKEFEKTDINRPSDIQNDFQTQQIGSLVITNSAVLTDQSFTHSDRQTDQPDAQNRLFEPVCVVRLSVRTARVYELSSRAVTTRLRYLVVISLFTKVGCDSPWIHS